MREEKKTANPKLRALNWLYETLYKDEIIPRISFKKFKEENTFFLDGLTIKNQIKEFNMFYFYTICNKVKLPIHRSEVKDFFDLTEK
jgi:hypothetical protein